MWNRANGEVYLEGGLERGVVPEDCFWTHCGGEGEDGCALYLRKMNLELLQKWVPGVGRSAVLILTVVGGRWRLWALAGRLLVYA